MPDAATHTPISNIGISVTYDGKELENVISLGEFGGSPNMLDVTTVKDSVKKNIPGVQDQGAWEIQYQFVNKDASDTYRILQADSDTNPVPVKSISVTFPDGTVLANTAQVSNKIDSIGVDQVITCTASFALQGKWTITNPQA